MSISNHLQNLLDEMDEISAAYFSDFSQSLKRDTTKQQYLSIILDAMRFSGTPFHQIGQMEAYNYFQSYKGKIDRQECKGSTVYKKFLILSGFSDYMLHAECSYLPPGEKYVKNPFSIHLFYLKRYATSKAGTVIPLRDIDRLLEAAKEDLLCYACITALYRSAIRPSDLCTIRACDIRPVGDAWVIETRRDQVDQPIYFSEDIVAVIKKYMATNYIALSSPEASLFVNNRRTPLKERDLQRMILAVCQKAGTKNYTPYDIRNSSAALMYAYGADDSAVAGQLGIQTRHVRRYKSASLEQEISRAPMLVNLRVVTPR